MKKHLLTPALLLLQIAAVVAQQALHLIGVPGKNDRVTKMIRTPDGGYLMAGMVNHDAALYRFGCDGTLRDSIRKDLPTANSFEVFNDVVALGDGSFVAVGEATSTDGSIKHGIAIRVNATLDEMHFDTFFVNGKSAAVKKILLTPAGEAVIAGVQAGVLLDFGDAFVVKFDKFALRPTASVAVFSYGIDEVRGLSRTTSGNLLISGYSTLGNIFDVNATLTNTAWVRAIQFPNGAKIWETTHAESFANRFGRSYFEDAIENPLSGNILAGGTIFSTADTSRSLDPHFRLLDKDGNLLDQLTLPIAGAQNLNEVQGLNSTLFALVAVGDSGQVHSTTANFSFPFFGFVAELAGKILYLAHGSDPATPLSIQTLLPIKTDVNAVAGTFFFPPGQANNQEILVSIPNFTIEITQANNELFAAVEPTGNYKYQWFFENTPLAGQTSPTLSAAADGKYQVVVTDELGCSTTAEITVSGAGQTDAPIFKLASDTVCTNFPLVFQEIVPDADSYQWTFSDGLGSQQPLPTKSFKNLGKYIVQLTAKTSPGQYFVSEIKINSHEPYSDIFDPKPDIYFILKNAAGAEIYRSRVFNNIDQLPLSIPCALLLSNGTYLIELWDFDLLDTDDQLGLVFIQNPTAGGTFSFGNLSLFFQTKAAAANYVFSKTVVVIEPYITQNGMILTANLDKNGSFQYIWYRDGQPISGANQKDFDSTGGGWEDCYTVTVVGEGMCNNLSQPFCLVAASEISDFQNLKIFPVPSRAGEVLQIDFGKNAPELVEIQLIDNLGRRVEQWLQPQFLDGKFGFTLPNRLSAGIFFLNFKTAGGDVFARRLVLMD